MKHNAILFYIIVSVHLFFWIIFLITNNLKLEVFLSYEIAFFSILLVVLFSYLNYKKAIRKKIEIYKKNFKNIPLIFIKTKQIIPKKVHFKAIKEDLNMKDKIHFFTLFFSLFKLIAYMILVAGFLFLHRQDKLNILAYICGISSLLVCIFIFLLYIKKHESKKNY
ncbi:hypothetical protein N4T57_04715 [Campylobacter hepaticus]|uniref:hypothetical protein n=1 Tax=Campylobacter hepaticus TaxID=1813019 RepID=UPI00082790A1|nr:hypothetical protein [Campylobacter hepaticus]MCZ0772447.1 hypothetical protein [Campylobacter hepaticus]MCZ0773915.1 hypothetical protein [Campylobacter hepaticus]MCZ0775166.1 hypothetical protein [Campylobacter hepaticus]QPM44434.1 hypothetical protein I5Q61_02580 [Campylobacter hepaticus]WAP50147.1 hypothetical protein N3Z98_03070 [Campylobacter hepaticus]